MRIENMLYGDKFVPVKFSIEIETKEEIIELWHRLNVSSHLIQQIYREHSGKEKEIPETDGVHNLWCKIDDIKLMKEIEV